MNFFTIRQFLEDLNLARYNDVELIAHIALMEDEVTCFVVRLIYYLGTG